MANRSETLGLSVGCNCNARCWGGWSSGVGGTARSIEPCAVECSLRSHES